MLRGALFDLTYGEDLVEKALELAPSKSAVRYILRQINEIYTIPFDFLSAVGLELSSYLGLLLHRHAQLSGGSGRGGWEPTVYGVVLAAYRTALYLHRFRWRASDWRDKRQLEMIDAP